MSGVEIAIGPGPGRLTDPSWDALVDEAGTPFQHSRFLLPWWRHTSTKDPATQLIAANIANGSQTIGICAFEISGSRLAFAGGQNVVDYMGPLAADGYEREVAEALTYWMFRRASWRVARLAGLVGTSTMTVELTAAVLRRAPAARVQVYDQAPGIDTAPQGYLAHLNSKKRLEVLRKRNRLIEEVGELQVYASTTKTLRTALGRLLTWKAAASPETAKFVLKYELLLRDLLDGFASAGAAHVMELRAGPRTLASAIVLKHRQTNYLYNMSYDPALTTSAHVGLAPGAVLVSYLAEQTLDAGSRFDFLRGAQPYKLHLGGRPTDLVEILIER